MATHHASIGQLQLNDTTVVEVQNITITEDSANTQIGGIGQAVKGTLVGQKTISGSMELILDSADAGQANLGSSEPLVLAYALTNNSVTHTFTTSIVITNRTYTGSTDSALTYSITFSGAGVPITRTTV